MVEIEVFSSKKTKLKTDVDSDDDTDTSPRFRAKRKSTAKIVNDDYVVERKAKRRKEKSEFVAKLEAWFQECEKLPPLYGDEPGEVDFSKAAFVEFDFPAMKQSNEGEYFHVLTFAYCCRQKRCLRLFHHPGDPRIDGLGSSVGNALLEEDHDLAVIAIEEYHKVNQKMKLKLRDLMKLNFSMSGGVINYITFSAKDELTGAIKTYQAALLEKVNGYLLGLFRNLVDDEILAILSIKGAEEDFAAVKADWENFEDFSDE